MRRCFSLTGEAWRRFCRSEMLLTGASLASMHPLAMQLLGEPSRKCARHQIRTTSTLYTPLLTPRESSTGAGHHLLYHDDGLFKAAKPSAASNIPGISAGNLYGLQAMMLRSLLSKSACQGLGRRTCCPYLIDVCRALINGNQTFFVKQAALPFPFMATSLVTAVVSYEPYSGMCTIAKCTEYAA